MENNIIKTKIKMSDLIVKIRNGSFRFLQAIKT